MNRHEIEVMASNEEVHWWFFARRHMLRDWARRFDSDSKVLDVGAGAGRHSKLLRDELQVSVKSLELSDVGVEFCKTKNLDVIQADATDMPFEDETFDGVVAMDILEHIPNDFQAVAEIARVMKNESQALITVPAFQFLWSAHDVSVSHVRRYTKKELFGLIENNGLKVVQIRYWNSILFPVGLLMRMFNADNSEMRIPTKFVNVFLIKLLTLETKMRFFGLFPGMSLVVEVRK